LKNYSVVGVHWARYRDHDPDAVIECHHELCRLHEQGGIKPLIAAEYALEDAVGALEALGSRGTVGKVVVTPEPRVTP
jgi:NADPH2:quinone reductase